MERGNRNLSLPYKSPDTNTEPRTLNILDIDRSVLDLIRS